MSRSSAQADDCHRVICEAQLGFFRAILEVDTDESWWQDGARDTAHWLVMRYGFSSWKANRFVEAARALESLPLVSEALGSGVLGTDKVVELTRFATPDTEAELVPWAESSPCAEIRDRGDEIRRQAVEDVRDASITRRCMTWDERFLVSGTGPCCGERRRNPRSACGCCHHRVVSSRC